MTTHTSQTESNSQRIFIEQVRLLYANTKPSSVTIIPCALGIVAALWSEAIHSTLLLWFGWMTVAVMARTMVTQAYFRATTQDSEAPQWANWLLYFTIPVSAGWGSMVLLFLPELLLERQTFVHIINAD